MTLCAEMILVIIYSQMGFLGVAETIGLRVLEAQKVLHGRDHQYVFDSMTILARTWLFMGRCDKAIPLLQDCIQRERKTISEHHSLTQNSLSLLRTCERAQVKMKMEEIRRGTPDNF